MNLYFRYARASTMLLFLSMLITYVLRQALRVGGDFWLADWSEHARHYEIQSDNSSALLSTNATVRTEP